MKRILLLICLPGILYRPFGSTQEKEVIPRDDFALVKRLHANAVAAATKAKLVDYKNRITTGPPEMDEHDLEYEMVAIEGGTFRMGSSQSKREEEGPAHQVKISPFWMGKYEVGWDLYEPFMLTDGARKPSGELLKVKPGTPDDVVISKPTTPYTDMSYGMGREGYPAISMTQHAASKFCQWLSAKTGHFYRLPTEAEWEYACRAGTTGPYSCPPEKIHEYAVCEPNIDDPVLLSYAKMGSKKPNPWGLYDMHGNVMEWCLDQYNSLTYAVRPLYEKVIDDPFIRANRIYPRVVRGGSWYDPPEDCRSARRWFSEPEWKQQDPQKPQSIWFHTDAIWLGFRVVRPFEVPSAEEMDAFWNSAHPDRVIGEE
jgi:formylglycine-generating enzyme required for sulfatase activity